MEFLVEDFKAVKDDTLYKDQIATLHHPDTMEPIFTIHSNYGRNVKMQYHPYMYDVHPHLKDSIEAHNFSGENNLERHRNFDSKSAAVSAAEGMYERFARTGFKDKLIKKTRPLSTDEINELQTKEPTFKYDELGEDDKRRTVRTYHDPDTDEVIGYEKPTHVPDHHWNKVQSKMFINSNYLSNNGIDHVMIKNPPSGHPYYTALHVYNQKSAAKPKLVGLSMNGGYSTYAVKTSPEEASSAHEDFIKKQHKGIEISRLSPTSFVGNKQPERYSNGKHVTSHIIGDVLHSTVSDIHHQDSYSYNPNKHNIM